MVKYILVTLLVVLSFFAVMQYSTINNLEQELVEAKAKYRNLEIGLAEIDGALTGLGLATWKDRSRLAEIKDVLQVKEHLISSLQKGYLLTVTAYSNQVSQTDSTPNITASNKAVRHGIVAVSQDLFAKGWVFGRKVYVVGVGVYTIEDLLNKRKRDQLDIFMFNNREALKFGRRKLRVYLLGT